MIRVLPLPLSLSLSLPFPLPLLLALAAPLAAQEALPAPPALVPVPEAPAPRTERVRIETGAGVIVLALEVERAPVTAANFLRMAREKRLDGTSFYRALKLTPDGRFGLVQGGFKGDPKRALPPIAHEPTVATGLSHVDGAISMARAAPGSAQGDFFLIVGGLPSLDARGDGAGDAAGYAVFGRVVEGMEVVKAILEAPVDPGAGEGSMKGQMIVKPVPILAVRVGG
jgi:peptidyl-prolyl cis-trans isomerase A (cyclophilin A)